MSKESFSRAHTQVCLSTSALISVQQHISICMAFHKDQTMKVTALGKNSISHQSHHPLRASRRSQLVLCGPITRRPVIINCLFRASYMLFKESTFLPASNRNSNGYARLFLALFFSFFLPLPHSIVHCQPLSIE